MDTETDLGGHHSKTRVHSLVISSTNNLFFFFWWEREGMRHAPSRLSADVEDSIRARQVGLRPLDGSALCPTP